jgi:hypothetical protein
MDAPIRVSSTIPNVTGEATIGAMMNVSDPSEQLQCEIMPFVAERLMKALMEFKPPAGHEVTSRGKIVIETKSPSDPLMQGVMVYAKQIVRIERIKQPYTKGVYQP